MIAAMQRPTARDAFVGVVGACLAAMVGCADSASARAQVIDSNPRPGVDAGGGGSLVAVGGDGATTIDRPSVEVVRDAVVIDQPRVGVDVQRPDAAVTDVVARDATRVDAGPAEACGNGRDDDGDGLVDEDCPATTCAAPAQGRTVAWFSGVSPPTGMVDLLREHGLTIRNQAFTADVLPRLSTTALLVLGHGVSGDTADAVRAWVDGGGALVTLIVGVGSSAPEECDAPTVLVSRFGLSYGCDDPVPWGPVSRLSAHPITAGLTVAATPYVNGRWVDARPGVGDTPLAWVDERVVARATSSGCGRVLVWGDEHISFTTYWATTRMLWDQALTWLLARP